MRKLVFVIYLLIILLSACQTVEKKEAIKPETYAKEIGTQYGDESATIIKTTKTQSDDSNEPMYLIFIKGNFTHNNQSSTYISFSATKYRHHIWAVKQFDKPTE